jgi:tetratricopeptide (TPR) repeat protein
VKLGVKFGVLFGLAISMAAAESAQPKIAQCFKVYDLVKMDEDHYWANWANACPYTIGSVYVMVRFSDRSKSRLGNGVWALHFVVPGTHQVTRFTAPRAVPDFDFVQVHKITTDSLEALLDEPGDRVHPLSAEAVRTGDPGPRFELASESSPRVVSESRVVSEATVAPETHVVSSPRVVADEGPAAWAAVTTVAPRPESQSAEEHHRRGRELIQEGKYSAAIDELSEAIRAQPDWSMVYNARGFAYYLEHDYQRALVDLDEAIRLNPQYLNAYQNRSRSRKAAGDTQGSAADSKKIRTLLGTR